MIVVTGGAGFIGSTVVWALNARGIFDVLVVDGEGVADETGNLKALRILDYVDKTSFLKKFMQGDYSAATAVIHLGACSDTTEADEQFLNENNFEYSRKLAEQCLNQKTRYVYASSAATYGDGAHGYEDDHAGVLELEPLNLYGWSKQKMDVWALENKVLNQIVGLKYFNIFGPNEYHKGHMRSVVHKAFYQIKEEGVISLFKSYRPDYADGEQKRDFLYVKDAVDMTLHLMNRKEYNGLFNIGSGQAHSWNELAAAIFKAMNLPLNISYVDMPDVLQGKYQYFTEANMSKFSQTGYEMGRISFEEGVRDYVQNYLMTDSYLKA